MLGFFRVKLPIVDGAGSKGGEVRCMNSFLFQFLRCVALSWVVVISMAMKGGDSLEIMGHEKEKEQKTDSSSFSEVPQRYEGWFVIQKIQQSPTSMRVFFVPEKLSDFKKAVKRVSSQAQGLLLKVGYLPPVMGEGLKLRLLAELAPSLSSHAPSPLLWIKIHQMLAYLPSSGGTSKPVWFLSQDVKSFSKGSLSYLKMHVPSSDYLAF